MNIDDVKKNVTLYTYDHEQPHNQLINYMSKLSQEYYSSGWSTDWGFTLWELVYGIPTHYSHGVQLRPSELLEVRRLSILADGWAEYVLDGEDLRTLNANFESHEYPQFIPMADWKTFYKHRERA